MGVGDPVGLAAPGVGHLVVGLLVGGLDVGMGVTRVHHGVV